MLAVAAGKDGDSKRRGSFVRSVIFGSYDVFLEKPSVSNGDVKAKSRPACRADVMLPSGRGMSNTAHLLQDQLWRHSCSCHTSWG
jgi:hypothetical protein